MFLFWNQSGGIVNAMLGALISWDSMFGGGAAPTPTSAVFMTASHVWGPL